MAIHTDTGGAAAVRTGRGAKSVQHADTGGGVPVRTGTGAKSVQRTESGGAARVGAATGAKRQVLPRTKTGGGARVGTSSGARAMVQVQTGGGMGARAGVGRKVRELKGRTGGAAARRAAAGPWSRLHYTDWGGSPSPPGYESYGAPYVAPSRRGLRFIARNIIGGQVVDWELPLLAPQITYTLSGPTMIKASIAPENLAIVEERIDAWATWIDVESDGIIRASGICQPVAIDGDEFSIEAVGVSGYPAGLPYMGELSEIRIDVLDAVREIWRHLLSFPDATPLNVELSKDVTGVLLGTPEYIEPELDTAGNPVTETVSVTVPATGDPKVAAATAIRDRINSGATIYEDLTWPDCPTSVRDHNDALLTDYENAGHAFDGTRTALADLAGWLHDWIGRAGTTTEVTRPKTRVVEEKPYALSWWADVDCGREIDALAKACPFDYVENPVWNIDRTAVTHRIELGFPRAGRLRDDLRFVLDENLLAAFVVRESASTYASQVVVRGKGEGRDGVRGQAGTRSPRRLRRVVVVTDRNVPDNERAAALAADELRRRASTLTVGEIVIHDWHPNAPLGSYQVGDDIVIQAPISYLGDVRLTHRILSYTWEPDNAMVTVSLARSEEFTYGRAPTPRDYEGEVEYVSDIPVPVAGDNTFKFTVMVENGSNSAVIDQMWLTFGVNFGTAHFEFQAYGMNGSTIGGTWSGDSGAPHGQHTVDLANHQRDYMTLPNGAAMVAVEGYVSSAAARPALAMICAPKR